MSVTLKLTLGKNICHRCLVQFCMSIHDKLVCIKLYRYFDQSVGH